MSIKGDTNFERKMIDLCDSLQGKYILADLRAGGSWKLI